MSQSAVSSRSESVQESAIRRLVRVAAERLSMRETRVCRDRVTDPTSPSLTPTRDPDDMRTHF